MKQFTQLSDELLIDYVRRVDVEAYREIIKRYQKKLLRYASYLTQDDDQAADVVQEAFINAFINLNSFQISRQFSSWIYRIVHNEAMSLLKKNKVTLSFEVVGDLSSAQDLQEDLILQELKNSTKKCLSSLPILYREPLSLFYLEEKSYQEISQILKIPVGTVGTRVNRAKSLMRSLCQKNKLQ